MRLIGFAVVVLVAVQAIEGAGWIHRSDEKCKLRITSLGKKYTSLCTCELKQGKYVYWNRLCVYYIRVSTVGVGWVKLKNREKMSLDINVVQ